MEEKRIYYKSDKISVSFAPDVCIHSAECVKGLSTVFNTLKKPWINVNAESPEKIAAVIDRCPSGALKYKFINEDESENKKEELKMDNTKITVMPNGPLMIEGNLSVKKMSGEQIKDGEKLFLCRCGYSSKKPFCDGAHKKENFTAE